MNPILQLLYLKPDTPIRFLIRLVLIGVTVSLAGGFFSLRAENYKARIKLLTPSVHGSTGLFRLPLAESLRRGELSLGWAVHRFHRDPGALKFTTMPVSFGVGLHDRLEFFASFEVDKQLSARDVLTDKPSLDDSLLPAVVASAGVIGYYDDSPFVDVAAGRGTGSAGFGLKVNLLSENRGNALSLAVQPRLQVPGAKGRRNKLSGLTSGATDAGLDLLISKVLVRKGTLTGKAGFFSGRDVEGTSRQNRAQWGLGFEWPVWRSSLDLIAEIVGDSFLGAPESPLINVVSPLEVYGGVRVRTVHWLTLSGGVNLGLRNAADGPNGIVPADRYGWVLQASFQRKINRSPTISCKLEEGSLLQGDAAVISAVVSDPDDDYLWISWKSSGGRLLERGSVVELDTTDLQPGSYTVVGEVGDDRNVASCVTAIEVKKHKVPPTVECRPVPRELIYGGSVVLVAGASDANGDHLSYVWTVNDLEIRNNRDVFEFGTVGRSTGLYNVRVVVEDVDGMSAECSYELEILPGPDLR